MPRIVRMPTEQELPRGARRDFVEAIFSLYREARRPTLRDTAKRLREAILRLRRVLRRSAACSEGRRPSWQIVNAVVQALCRIADVDPDADPGYEPGAVPP